MGIANIIVDDARPPVATTTPPLNGHAKARPQPFGHWQGDDLVLSIQLQPRASRDEIVGQHGDRLKIRITSPPVDGKANSHLIRYLASEFAVAKSAISLISGNSSRSKRLRIHAPTRIPATLTKHAASPPTDSYRT